MGGLWPGISRAWLLVMLFLGGIWTAAAASVVKMSLKELTRQASIIIVGKVTGKASEQTSDGIKTRITIAVADSLKGKVGRTVVITQPGGVVGEMEMVVSEAATFEVGEDVVTFLWTRPNGEHTVLGLSQGKFPVELDAAGRKFVRLPPEKDKGPGERVRMGDFVQRIQGILKQEREHHEDASGRAQPR